MKKSSLLPAVLAGLALMSVEFGGTRTAHESEFIASLPHAERFPAKVEPAQERVQGKKAPLATPESPKLLKKKLQK